MQWPGSLQTFILGNGVDDMDFDLVVKNGIIVSEMNLDRESGADSS